MPEFQASENPEDVVVPPEVQIQPTEVLAKEMLNRGHCGIIYLVDHRREGKKLKRDIFYQWRGFPHEVLGLIEELKMNVQASTFNEIMEGDGEDPAAEDWRSP